MQLAFIGLSGKGILYRPLQPKIADIFTVYKCLYLYGLILPISLRPTPTYAYINAPGICDNRLLQPISIQRITTHIYTANSFCMYTA